MYSKDYRAPKAQDSELGLKCEIPPDAILASNSFDTTMDQCRSVQTIDHSYQWETKHSLAEMAAMRVSNNG